MSRIGKIPIRIPKEVKAAVEGSSVRLEGPKGKLALDLPVGIKVESKDDQLVISRNSDLKQNRANHCIISPWPLLLLQKKLPSRMTLPASCPKNNLHFGQYSQNRVYNIVTAPYPSLA